MYVCTGKYLCFNLRGAVYVGMHGWLNIRPLLNIFYQMEKKQTLDCSLTLNNAFQRNKCLSSTIPNKNNEFEHCK
jgi:hypothetical protein